MHRNYSLLWLLVGFVGGVAIAGVFFSTEKQATDASPEAGDPLQPLRISGAATSDNTEMVDLGEKLAAKGLGELERAKLLSDAAARTDRNAFPGVIAEIVESGTSRHGYSNRSDQILALYERWTRVDPLAAADHAIGVLDESYRNSVLTAIMPMWLESDYRDAVRWLKNREKGDFVGSREVYEALRSVAGVDPELAVELATTHPAFVDPAREADIAFIAGEWAQSDPESAAEFAFTIQSESDRRNAISFAVEKWGHDDFESAWNWSQAIEKYADRVHAQGIILRELAERSPEEAYAVLGNVPVDSGRRAMAGYLYERVGARDPEAAFTFASENFEEPARSELIATVMRYWPKQEPEKAFEAALDSMPLGSRRQQALEDILSVVAYRDFENAITMYRRVEPVGVREQLLGGIARNFVRADLGKSLEFVESLPQGPGRESFYASIVAELDDREATDYALALTRSGKASNNLLDNSLRSWAEDSPRGAVRWVLTHGTVADQDRILPGLASRWAKWEPVEAAAWAEEIDESELKEAVFERLVGEWVQIDIDSAGEWLNRISRGSSRDAAVSTFAERVSGWDPTAAMAWSEKIDDEKRRNQTIEYVGKRWFRNNPAGAERWLRSSNLPVEVIEDILDTPR